MLMRFDPFRELDRLADFAGPARAPRSFPMDAFRRGDHFIVRFDLPGVDPDSIDLTVDRNMLIVTAQRRADQQQDDQVVVLERPEGQFSRQLMLGDQLDSERVQAEYKNGVLELTIPVAAQAKPRRIQVTAKGGSQQIEGGASGQGDSTAHGDAGQTQESARAHA